MTRTPDPPNPDKPGRFTLALPLSRQSWRQLPLYRAINQKRPAPTRCERKSERKTQDQTKSYVGDVWKLMTVPREGAERLRRSSARFLPCLKQTGRMIRNPQRSRIRSNYSMRSARAGFQRFARRTENRLAMKVARPNIRNPLARNIAVARCHW